MAYVIPGSALSVVMTSDRDVPRANAHVHTLHALLVEAIMPVFAAPA
jgi:hypothetical protein